ncbi:MAG: ABC transporter permease, partial [Acidobacteriota bacterium]
MRKDLQYALRALRRSPGFTLSALLALTLGIGANTAVFSLVYATLLKPLPYAEPNRLVVLYERNARDGIERGEISPGTFADWRARSRTLESLALYTRGDALWSFGDVSDIVPIASVSPALFSLLRANPMLGQTFRPEADQPKPDGDRGDVVIGYTLWQRRFSGSADAIGQVIRVEGRTPLRIIGVMPRGFAFPERTEAWTNLPILRPIGPGERQVRYYRAIGRLAPAVTLADARVELAALSSQLELEQPRSNAGWTSQIEGLSESARHAERPALLALFGA